MKTNTTMSRFLALAVGAVAVLGSGLAQAEGEQFIYKGAAVPVPQADEVILFLDNRGTVDLECQSTLEAVARNAVADESTVTSEPMARVLRAGRSVQHHFAFSRTMKQIRNALGDESWRIRAVPPQAFDLTCSRVGPDDPDDPDQPVPGPELIALATPGRIRLYEPDGLGEVKTISGEIGRVLAAEPVARVLASASNAPAGTEIGIVTLWSADSGERLGRFSGPAVPKAAVFSADGRRLFVAGGDGCTDDFTCRKGALFSYEKSGTTWVAKAHVAATGMLTDVATSAADTRLVVTGTGVVGFYDQSLASHGTRGLAGGGVGSAVRLADGATIVGAGQKLFRCATDCTEMASVPTDGGAIVKLAAAPQAGGVVVATTRTGGSALRLHDPVTGRQLAFPLAATERVFNVAHAAKRSLVASAAVDYAADTQLVLETWDTSGTEVVRMMRKVIGRPEGTWSFGVAFLGAP